MKTQALKNTLLVAVAGLVAVGLGVAIGGKVFKAPPAELPAQLHATYLPEGKVLTDFELIDQDNRPFDRSRLQGHWSVLFFGYTHCPDVCPTTLQVMKNVWTKLPRERFGGAEPQMIFVSVDPGRDTPERLKKYVKYYNEQFIGVTGKLEKLDGFVDQLGVMYGYEDPPEGSEHYLVNHTSRLILIDPQGKMRAVLSPPHRQETILQALLSIQSRYKG